MDQQGNISAEFIPQIQKSLEMLRTSVEVYKTVNKTCRLLIDSVINLTEQYQCCDRVKLSMLPQKVDFADVKDRLLFKIGEEINKELYMIQTELRNLEDSSIRLGTHYTQCMGSYKKHCSIDCPDIVLDRSATKPSIAEVLECLETSSRLYRERCLCKQLLVHRFSPHQPDVCDTFFKQWSTGDSVMLAQLEEHLALCSGFFQPVVT